MYRISGPVKEKRQSTRRPRHKRVLRTADVQGDVQTGCDVIRGLLWLQRLTAHCAVCLDVSREAVGAHR